MEKELEILVVCCHQQIADTIVRLINKEEEMNAVAVNSAAQALATFNTGLFDLVLIGSGLAPEAEQELKASLQEINPTIPVIYHFGGGSGLLFTEIKQAM